MKSTPKIIKIVICVVVVFVALWFLVPAKNGPRLFIVLSGSMQPAIRTGSVVVVKPAEQYNIGDVITFDSGKGTSTTHRIVALNDVSGVSMFSTKGDANNTDDAVPVSKEAIKGKVLFSVPYFGYLISSLKTKQGLLVIIVIGAIIIYREMMRIQKEIKELARKRKDTVVNKEKNE
jgi:signal peptidase